MTSKVWLVVGGALALACSSGNSGEQGYQCAGSGTMTAKVGADLFTSTCLSATNQQGLVILQGVDDSAGKNSNEVNIYLVGNIPSTGTYSFKNDGDPDITWAFKGRAARMKPQPTGVDLGSIVVTKLTATQIEGTFTAKTVTTGGATEETIDITEGKFSGTFGAP